MARIRTFKPTFWTDGKVMPLPPQARELFMGSWNFALCDFGHVADDPWQLKMQVLPADQWMMVFDTEGQPEIRPFDPVYLVDLIVASGRMVRLEVDGRSFLHVLRFTDHQKTEQRWTPRCPVCRATTPVEPPRTSPNLSETPGTSARERKGKDGKGKSAAAGGGDSSLPTSIAILRDKLQAFTPLRALRFDGLDNDRITLLEALIELHGDEVLVETAKRTLRATPPVHVAAFIGTWAALPEPGQRLALVRQQLCPIHATALMPSGTCGSCQADLKVGDQ